MGNRSGGIDRHAARDTTVARLTDSDMVAIIALTTPLAPYLRDQFLKVLAVALQGREVTARSVAPCAALVEPPRNGVRASAES